MFSSHVTSDKPVPDSTNTDSEKPALNGDNQADAHEGANGVKEDTEMGDAEPSASTEDGPAPAEEKPQVDAPETNPKESSQDSPKSPLERKPESPKDVEMTDTKEPTPPAPAPVKTEETKTEDASAPESATAVSADPTPKDVAQEDVKVETEVVVSAEVTDKASEPTKDPAEGQAVKVESQENPSKDDSTLPTSEVDLQPASLSQLAIETADGVTSPVHASVEVSMTEAPGAKFSREREDDAVEEPASKRAKTEPKEDEPITEASTPAPAASSEVPVTPTAGAAGNLNIEELPKWNDADFHAKSIQPFQLRDLRKSMARVKKTKNGLHFRDSVQKLWPALWDKYSEAIDKPMDLSEIDRNLRDNKYKTFGEVRDDLVLLVNNSLAYNGPDHTMTLSAKAAIKSVWDDMMLIPNEEPVKQKPLPKQSRVREARSVNVKPDPPATAPAPAGPPAGSSTATAAPKPAGGAAHARRASTTADVDRPKRTVRAPKPKDIDYTTKPSRKKLKPELQFADEVLTELMRDKHFHLNQWFNEPVDAEGLGIPHYYSVITNPMDFGKVHRMLHGGEISNLKDFEKNLRLVFTNCYKFNGEPEQGNVSQLAKQLEDIYDSQMKGKDAWLAKHAKSNPPPASASAGSDEEEEEEEEAGEDAGPDPSSEVKDLEVRLREEMDKQANLFAAEQPNQSMIQIQQGIVNMVQQALLQAKQKLNEYKQKNGGASKPKKAKAAKPKGGAKGGAGKASGAAAQPKKGGAGGGGAQKKKKKNLTAADKDNIANAINDLEYPHLDKAIDIIKRDTGQMVSSNTYSIHVLIFQNGLLICASIGE